MLGPDSSHHPHPNALKHQHGHSEKLEVQMTKDELDAPSLKNEKRLYDLKRKSVQVPKRKHKLDR